MPFEEDKASASGEPTYPWVKFIIPRGRRIATIEGERKEGWQTNEEIYSTIGSDDSFTHFEYLVQDKEYKILGYDLKGQYPKMAEKLDKLIRISGGVTNVANEVGSPKKSKG